ncbi:Rv2253/PknI dimerization domain-containing protein [Mycobacterium colombiense]
MRLLSLLNPALALALACGVTVPTAAATGDDWGLNGTYAAVSNGDWAKTNDIYHNEATVRSTWTVSTTCSTPLECTGRVTSDQGWSADVGLHGSEYVVKRDIPDWEPCANGAARTGHQIYRFYPVDERGWVATDSTSKVLAGVDQTTGDSGACGINKALVISLPFRLDKVG